MEREREQVMTEMRKAKARGDETRLRELGREQQELARGIARLSTARTSQR